MLKVFHDFWAMLDQGSVLALGANAMSVFMAHSVDLVSDVVWSELINGPDRHSSPWNSCLLDVLV